MNESRGRRERFLHSGPFPEGEGDVERAARSFHRKLRALAQPQIKTCRFMNAHLLIVEDDPALNQMLVLHFEDEGFQVEGAITCVEALEQLEANSYDLLLLGQQLPDGTGMELLDRVLSREPDLPVVMMTGQHDLELAIEAIKKGAADFVHKPVQTAELQQSVGRLLEHRRLSRELQALRGAQETLHPERDLIGRSSAMLTLSKEIAFSACSAATVLISGESGTGKEVVACLIHQHSGGGGGARPACARPHRRTQGSSQRNPWHLPSRPGSKDRQARPQGAAALRPR